MDGQNRWDLQWAESQQVFFCKRGLTASESVWDREHRAQFIMCYWLYCIIIYITGWGLLSSKSKSKS
jgi:hypothetical protein